MRPNTDLVGVAWLKSIPELVTAGAPVATTLPKVNDQLRTTGFIRTMIVGGSPNPDVPVRGPVITAQCWAAQASGSSKTPWNHAAQLAEWIWQATYDRSLMNVELTIPLPGYDPAFVLTVIALTEPRRVQGDEPLFARFDVDLHFNWRNAA